jgi:hypothetical protein
MPKDGLRLTPADLDPYLRQMLPHRQYSSRKYRYGVKDDSAVLDTVVVLKLLVEDWILANAKLNDDQELLVMMEIDFQPVADAFDADDFSRPYHLAFHDWKHVSLPNVHDRFLQLTADFGWVDSLPAPAITIMACDLMAVMRTLEATHVRLSDPARRSVQSGGQAPPDH